MHGVPLSNGKHRKFFAETSSLIVLLISLRFAAAPEPPRGALAPKSVQSRPVFRCPKRQFRCRVVTTLKLNFRHSLTESLLFSNNHPTPKQNLNL